MRNFGSNALKVAKVRSLFLSDVHLGTVSCQAELLLDFLSRHHADQIYLVGDIVDGWRLKSRWYWPPSHDAVVAALLAKAQAGARVLYLPGNHDAFLRASLGTSFAGIEVVEQAIHEAADGKRYLVVHGDQFDVVTTRARWLAVVGDAAYRMALRGDAIVNRSRGRDEPQRPSLSAWANLKVMDIVNRIGNYERAVLSEAERHGVQGVICGHIHHASMHDEFGIRYINTGDWIDSCTAVVEHGSGKLEIVRWKHALRQDHIRERIAAVADA